MARETSEEFAHRAGLVRAVALDGSVWFVSPELKAAVEAMESAYLTPTPEQLAGYESYDRNYWTHHDGTSSRKATAASNKDRPPSSTKPEDPSNREAS